MTDKHSIAEWDFSLHTECPKCDEWVDLLQCGDFFEWNQRISIGENRENVEAQCPLCGHEFKVETIY